MRLRIVDCGLRGASEKRIGSHQSHTHLGDAEIAEETQRERTSARPLRSLRLCGERPRWKSPFAFMLSVSIFLLLSVSSFAQPPRKKNAPPPGAEPPPVSLEEAAKLEAVITTDLGVIRFEFFPAKAPKHVQAFVKNARAGFYDGSAFHRVIRLGVIQGGDPLLKDPTTPRARWGSVALSQRPDEFR